MKAPGFRNSGLVMCWHVILVYFLIQMSRGVGVSAARWVYLSLGLWLGLKWSLWAVQIRSAMSCLMPILSSSSQTPVPAFLCILEAV